jgi:hypothetical protein
MLRSLSLLLILAFTAVSAVATVRTVEPEANRQQMLHFQSRTVRDRPADTPGRMDMH